jgi:hypothetical protein
MVYVRKKSAKSRTYYQLVECRRVNKKPRQQVLMHLGKHSSVEDAMEAWHSEAERLRREGRYREAAELDVKVNRLFWWSLPGYL